MQWPHRAIPRGPLGLVQGWDVNEEELADEVLRAVRRIVRRVSEHSRYLSKEAGLTVPQLLCLKAIGDLEAEVDEVGVAMVARDVQLAAATVSRIVDRLERAELVVRERRSQDRRKVCLSLTPRGMERYQNLPQPLQESFVQKLMDLSERQRKTLLRSLNKVVEMMDAEDIDASPVLAPGLDVKEEG